MKLKESYRYQNFLDSLINQAETILMSDITKKITETHYISKAVPGATDEIKSVTPAYEYDANKVLDLIVSLIDEKQKLSTAIANAKKNTEIDIDSSMAMNKVNQKFVEILNILDSIKAFEKEDNVRGYTMNKEGSEQISISYPRKTVTEINFDRSSVRGLIKKITKQCDELSTKKDLADLTVEVDFTPTYDLTDKLDTLLL